MASLLKIFRILIICVSERDDFLINVNFISAKYSSRLPYAKSLAIPYR